MEIEASGRMLRVTINGRQVVGANLEQFSNAVVQISGFRHSSGRIGLQNWERMMQFRNIEIQDLTAR